VQRPVILRSRTRLLEAQKSMAQPPKDKHITSQLHYRKCGKPNCRTCRTGRGHSPYWYACWYDGSRLRSSYLGKTLAQASASDAPPAAPPQARHATSPPWDSSKTDSVGEFLLLKEELDKRARWRVFLFSRDSNEPACN